MVTSVSGSSKGILPAVPNTGDVSAIFHSVPSILAFQLSVETLPLKDTLMAGRSFSVSTLNNKIDFPLGSVRELLSELPVSFPLTDTFTFPVDVHSIGVSVGKITSLRNEV